MLTILTIIVLIAAAMIVGAGLGCMTYTIVGTWTAFWIAFVASVIAISVAVAVVAITAILKRKKRNKDNA